MFQPSHFESLVSPATFKVAPQALLMPNSRATSSEGYSECGYAKATRQTLSYFTLVVVGAKFAFSTDVHVMNIRKSAVSQPGLLSKKYLKCSYKLSVYFHFGWACVRAGKIIFLNVTYLKV